MREWFRTPRYVVYWAEDSRRHAPAKSSLESFETESKQVASKIARIRATVRRFAESGTIRNNELFKTLGSNAVEFKAHQVRLFGVNKGREGSRGRLILTHAVKKKTKGSINDLVSTILKRLRDDPDWP